MPMRSELEALFPGGGHRFHVGVQRADARTFFASRDPTGGLLAERRRWLLGADAQRYFALTDEGRGVFDEFRALLSGWGLPAPGHMGELAATLEPDVLLLAPDAAGEFRLRGGALVFPSSWALEEKMGRPLQAIHGPVPGLNPAIGGQLDRMLQRLAPGPAWCRTNWGIAATDELNLHPARRLPAPGLPLRLEALWLRVEHQALVALPRTCGLAFGIRISLHRMDKVLAEGERVRQGLARELRTMPAEMRQYKRIDAIAPAVLAHVMDARAPG